MANVTVKVVGGSIKEIEASSVQDAKDQLGLTSHTAKVNNEVASDGDSLNDGDFVVFASAVKGGNK